MSNPNQLTTSSDFFQNDGSDAEDFVNNKDLLHILLDNHPDFIYFKNKNLEYIKINKKTAKALGLNDPDNAIGKTDSDFFPDKF